MTSRLFKQIIAAVAGLSLATAGAMSASAYPAGQDMALQLSKISGIVKGESLWVSASGVNPLCPVSFSIANNQAGTGARTIDTVVADSNYQTAQVTFVAPSTNDDYYVFGTTGSCSAQGTSKTAMQQILVGKTLTVSTSASVTSSKILTTAKATYATRPVADLKLTLRLYDSEGIVVAKSGVVKTDSTGTVKYTFSRTGLAKGTYQVKWFFQANTTYAPKVVSRSITLN